jgi:flagellar assembly protein FliH
MATLSRFRFDTDFAAPPPPPPAPPAPETPRIDVAEHEIRLAVAVAAARAEGEASGFAAGRAAAEARAAERIAEEAGRLSATARAILAVLDADRLRIEREALDVAVLAARKLAGTLIEREPLGEITALLRECLRPLARTPHLTVRLRPQDAERLEPELERLARETGFAGRLVLVADADCALGDCAIEWVDGGVVRERGAIEADITAAVERYLAARADEMKHARRAEEGAR